MFLFYRRTIHIWSLISEVELFWYIPYSHSVYNNAVQNKAQNSLEQAVNYCIMLNMGHGFRTGGPVSGWKSDIHGRERAYAAKNWASLPSRLEEAAARLRGVQIECMPALELIPKYRYKDVLLYLDPPYVLSSRAGGLQYAKEMSDADHEKLLEVILDHPGPVVLSGYDSDLYRNMLKDCIVSSWKAEHRVMHGGQRSYGQTIFRRKQNS